MTASGSAAFLFTDPFATGLNVEPLATISISGFFLYLSITILALWQRRVRPQAANNLSAYAFLAALWSVEVSLWRLGWLPFLDGRFAGRLPLYGLILQAAGFLLLTRSILPQPGRSRGWWAAGGAWLAAALLLELNPLRLPASLWLNHGWYIPLHDVATIVLVAGWAIFSGGAVWLTRRALHATGLQAYHNLFSYWTVILGLVVLGDGLFMAGFLLPGSALRMAGILLAGYALLTSRLRPFGYTIRQALGYLFVTALTVSLYVAGFLITQAVFQSWPMYEPVLAGLALAAVMALFLNPLLRLFGKRLMQKIAGEDQNFSQTLHQYSQNITQVLDLKLLANLALSTAGEAVEMRHGFLFLVEREKCPGGGICFRLQGVKQMDAEEPASIILPEGSPLMDALNGSRSPLTRRAFYDLPDFWGVSQAELDWWQGLEIEVVIPIHKKNEWIGLLALGSKPLGAPYDELELSLLTMLADQTAVALENTRLVEGLLRLNNEFRRAYAALEGATRNLERLDRTKSDFISIASHELRTPLTLIHASSQMLLDDPALRENPYYQQLLEKIQSGSLRLSEVVEAMLDVAKIDTRELELNPQPVSLYPVLRALLHELQGAVQERGQQMELRDASMLPAVEADLEALRKVFYHLITNAIKYTPDGGSITILGIERPPTPEMPQGGVEIVVSDTGIGIDPRLKELIFIKFYQTGELMAHSTGKTKFKGGGPGLGLAIAQGIVSAHGGKIWVESPGHDEAQCPGSRFHVLLPIKQDRPGGLQPAAELFGLSGRSGLFASSDSVSSHTNSIT